MEVVRLDDAAAFLEEAEPLLLADEARHNLILGIAGTIRDAPEIYPERSLWLVRDGAEVVGAALRTPPYNLILAQPRTGEALEALAEAVVDEELPGVVGTEPEVHDFAELRSRHSGSHGTVNMRQGVYALEHVEPLPGPPGTARVATAADDRELVLRWWIAFGEEVLHGGGPGRERAETSVDHKLDSLTGGILLWEDGGEPVSLAGWGGPTPNGIRIGPVYTPPELRGRGYATALTAELSEQLLDGSLFDGGRDFCFLYTDLANPTSNAIYERIGYRLVAEAAEVVFG
ncbi:MAG TPA: GNAT family N-acetyltransferase [Gaiellaceae bacterium]|nr:GNAT family N-acetyltransferase [Gaiellaceae bacterium]